MKSSEWAAVSFGITLALVVGYRLTLSGLIVLATLLLGAALLAPLFALRDLAEEWEDDLPEVQVEAVPSTMPHSIQAAPLLRLAPGVRRERRGGWPHLIQVGQGQDEPDSQQRLADLVQGERKLC